MSDYRGFIRKIVYSAKNETGVFRIMLVDEANVFQDTISVKGVSSFDLEEGMEVTFSGAEKTYNDAPQIEASYIAPYVEPTVSGAHGWLKTTPVFGFGEKSAEKLIKAFPENIIDALQDVTMLVDAGINADVAESLVGAWSCLSLPNDVLELVNMEILPQATLLKMLDRYGAQLRKILSENPWSMVGNIRGFGFKSADAIAVKMGADMNSEVRFKMAITHVFREVISNGGHTLAAIGHVISGVKTLGIYDREQVEHHLGRMVASGEIMIDEVSGSYCLPNVMRYEAGISKNIERLSKGFNMSDEDRAEICKRIDISEKALNMKLDPSQRDAVIASLMNPVSIITGGPGTGKSTTQAIIVDVLGQDPSEEVLKMAPTGMASQRLSDAAGGEASTLHRGLKFDVISKEFVHSIDNPLDGTTIIVDEFSMVDCWMAHSLFEAVGTGARIIMVGDDQQLPSVGAGQVLADLIKSESVCVSRLEVIHRQAKLSGIIRAAHATIKGEMPEFDDKDFRFVPANTVQEFYDEIIKIVSKDVPESGQDASKDLMILSPQRKGELGSAKLNEIIKDSINPFDEEAAEGHIEMGKTRWSVGDRVMHVRNDYDKNIFNGSVGTISKITKKSKFDGTIEVDFGDEMVATYDPSDVRDIQHSWASTIHKVQGSEAPIVILVMSMLHEFMLERNLIFTGQTRPKATCFVVGQKSAWKVAIDKKTSSERRTALRHILRKDRDMVPYALEKLVRKPTNLRPRPRVKLPSRARMDISA